MEPWNGFCSPCWVKEIVLKCTSVEDRLMATGVQLPCGAKKMHYFLLWTVVWKTSTCCSPLSLGFGVSRVLWRQFPVPRSSLEPQLPSQASCYPRNGVCVTKKILYLLSVTSVFGIRDSAALVTSSSTSGLDIVHWWHIAARPLRLGASSKAGDGPAPAERKCCFVGILVRQPCPSRKPLRLFSAIIYSFHCTFPHFPTWAC